MKSILPMDLDQEFKDCILALHHELGINRFMLTGGEPTLHPQLREICSFIKELGCRILITTNGTVKLDWDSVPVDRVAVSFHSPSAGRLSNGLRVRSAPLNGVRTPSTLSWRICVDWTRRK